MIEGYHVLNESIPVLRMLVELDVKYDKASMTEIELQCGGVWQNVRLHISSFNGYLLNPV